MPGFIETYKGLRKAQKKPDGIFTTYLSRPVSPVFAYIGIKLNLSPNVISFISLILGLLSAIILFYAVEKKYFIIAGILWWLSAILDSSDGELARYSGKESKFGVWLDSFIDRIKEFIIFCLIAYIAFRKTGSELYLLLGVMSVFSTVMSGYISDTKKLFVKKRTLEIQFSNNYAFQMVDTRDFLITVAIMTGQFGVLLWVYGTVFVLAVFIQSFLFYRKYHISR